MQLQVKMPGTKFVTVWGNVPNDADGRSKVSAIRNHVRRTWDLKAKITKTTGGYTATNLNGEIIQVEVLKMTANVTENYNASVRGALHNR